MTKYVECIVNNFDEKCLTKGKVYEVLDSYDMANTYKIINDEGCAEWYFSYKFKELEAPKEETNTFKFIPETEIQYVTVNDVKGILIKE